MNFALKFPTILFALTFALTFAMSGAAYADESQARAQMTAAWNRIMDDLEKPIREHNTAGPGISHTLEEYGIEAPEMVNKLSNNLKPELKPEFDLLVQNFKFRSGQDVYYEDYERNISEKEFSRKMWTQFESSFNREVRTLSPQARGLLMAHFTTQWQMRPPTIRPIVFYAWFGQQKVLARASKLATLLIWRSGNPTAIREFIPQLMTNRVGGYALDLGVKHAADEKQFLEPLAGIEAWHQKFPQATAHAIATFDEAATRGELKRSALYSGEIGEAVWASTPQHEIHDYITSGYAKKFTDLPCIKEFAQVAKSLAKPQ